MPIPHEYDPRLQQLIKEANREGKSDHPGSRAAAATGGDRASDADPRLLARLDYWAEFRRLRDLQHELEEA